MSQTTNAEVYRVTLGSQVCRSGFALLNLNIRDIQRVSAVSATDDGTLIVVAEHGADVYDRLVGAVVDAGFDPLVVTVAELEHVVDPNGISFEQAMHLGLVEAPKVPVRAATVQRLAVSVTDGYDPDTILVATGAPIEIEFSEGHGCLGRVVFDTLGIEADLEHGGALVKLPALAAGTYPFRCGRDIVHGTLIAE